MKNNIFPPDAFVRDNIKFIRMLGKKATNVDIVKMVRDEAVRQHISVGCEYSEAQRLADEYLQRGSTADQMFMLLCSNNWYWGGRQVYRFDESVNKTNKKPPAEAEGFWFTWICTASLIYQNFY